ncbi:MAG: protein BatD, partial [Gammaproteobacteria bacterium]|nr:protein BatD [Gammaproteobacteria bacterium]
YLLFPQRSGNITLPAAIFSSNNLFIQGTAPTLTVRPRPDSGDNNWLPAMELQLHQTIDQPEGGIHSGMQLRRTILIQARGLTGAQLPTTAAPQLDGMEIQELGSELEQEIVAGVVVGQRRIRQLLIPRRGGDFILPRVQIQWWNSTVNSPQTASLPATTLTVMDSPVPQTQSAASPPAEAGEENRIEQESIPESSSSLILLALLISLLVYGLLIWHYQVFPRLQHRLHIIACRRRFKLACMANNPVAANTALLSWGDLVMGKDAVLSVLGLRKLFTDAAACAALLELDRAMYSSPKPDWSGRVMLERLLPLMKNHKQPQPDPGQGSLPPLYG